MIWPLHSGALFISFLVEIKGNSHRDLDLKDMKNYMLQLTSI